MGLSAGLTKAFAKDKFKLGSNASFFSTQLNGSNYSNTLSIGLNIGYQPHKGHSLNLGINLVNRSFTDATRQGSADILGYFGYTFNF
jgi:hypothetical protein